MYFELIRNSKEDPRSGLAETAINLHFCIYYKDCKGRQLVGAPISTRDELNVKIDRLQEELEEMRRQASQYLP